MDRACQRVLQMVGHSTTAPGDAEGVVQLVTLARETAWQCCVLAQVLAPGAVSDVPADPALAAAHRALARTATACAQAAQALMMAPGPDAAARAARAAVRCADEALAALDPPVDQLS